LPKAYSDDSDDECIDLTMALPVYLFDHISPLVDEGTRQQIDLKIISIRNNFQRFLKKCVKKISNLEHKIHMLN
jgi:hypothetical protein